MIEPVPSNSPGGAGYPRSPLKPTPNYGIRFLAFLIDLLPFLAIYLLLVTFLFLPMQIDNFHERFEEWVEETRGLTPEEIQERVDLQEFLGQMFAVMLLTFPLLLFAWFFGFEMAFRGGSLGKRIFRLRVYYLPTKKPVRQGVSFARALLKTFCVFFSISGAGIGLLFAVAIFLLPVFNRRQQALHDMISKTMVFQDDWIVQQMVEAQSKSDEDSSEPPSSTPPSSSPPPAS